MREFEKYKLAFISQNSYLVKKIAKSFCIIEKNIDL